MFEMPNATLLQFFHLMKKKFKKTKEQTMS